MVYGHGAATSQIVIVIAPAISGSVTGFLPGTTLRVIPPRPK